MYILEDLKFNLTYFKFVTKHYTFSSSGKLKITVPVNTKSLSMLIFYDFFGKNYKLLDYFILYYILSYQLCSNPK